MDFILNWKADLLKENKIWKTKGIIGVSLNLTSKEIMSVVNEPEMQEALIEEIKEKHHASVLNVEVYDIEIAKPN